MNILITGASGFLGKNVAKILKEKNYNTTIIGRKKRKIKNYIHCNLNNLKKFELILRRLKPDVVINLAAEVSFKKKTKNLYKINSLCPHLIAKYCKENNSHFIHASSIVVNGVRSIYNKKTSLNPINEYGKSKLKAERLIIKSNCKFTILRFGGIYGRNGPNHLGINKFIKSAIKGKRLIFKGNKMSLRNYVFVKDAAKFILKCLRQKKYGIFYVGGEIISFNSMLKKINNILGKSKNIIFVKNNNKQDNQIIKTNNFVNFTSFEKSLKTIK